MAAQPAETPVVLITASFANVPADHNGDFTFQLNFSENVEAGYARIGTTPSRWTAPPSTLTGRPKAATKAGTEVDPTGNGEVTITLPETTDCDDANLPDDDRMLSHATSDPPAISVSDATVQEAEGASWSLHRHPEPRLTGRHRGLRHHGVRLHRSQRRPHLQHAGELPDLEVSRPDRLWMKRAETLTRDLVQRRPGHPGRRHRYRQHRERRVHRRTRWYWSRRPSATCRPPITGHHTSELDFSENVKAGYERIRDEPFTAATSTGREQGTNQYWTITVKPDGNASVYITLPETTDCDADAAICTYDKRKLSHTNVATINGPG